MTFDGTVHVAELLVLFGAAMAIFRGGIGMRDAVRDLKMATFEMRKDVDDHEDRLRELELGGRRVRPDRRGADRT